MEWPTIPLDRESLVVGRATTCDQVINHPSVSRQHFRLFRENGKWFVEDLDSRLGIRVDDMLVLRANLTEGDVFRFGGSPLYRISKGNLVPDPSGGGMAVTIRDLKIEVVSSGHERGVEGWIRKWKGEPDPQAGKKVLLQGVNLDISAGEFIGVIGSSGAGKSILMECLSAQRHPAEGQIRVDQDKDLFGNVGEVLPQIGSVPQQELIYSFLTVEENLRLAARLRLDAPEEVQAQRVEWVLEQIEMTEHRHKRSGLLSGGQQKRVNIGIELLRQPRLLLLDEPTSGLDPGLAGDLMDRLRLLSRRNLTVVCSTHTLDTIHYFDRVIVVGKRDGIGTVAYFDPPAGLLEHFQVRDNGALFEKLKQLPPGESGSEENTAASPTRSHTPSFSRPASPETTTANQPDATWKRGQTGVIWERTMLGIRRDRIALALAVGIQPLVLSFLVVLSQNDQSRGSFIHFFLIVCALWMGMNLSVRELVRERAPLDPGRPMLSLFFRDYLAGVHPNCHLAGKLLAFLPLVALQTLLVALYARVWIVMMISESTHQVIRGHLLATPFSVDFLILFLTGLGGLILGFVISAVARTERSAVAMLPLLLLPQLLLSRVAYGHGSQPWNEPSPFLPLADLGAYAADKASHVTGWLASVLSLPMVTRPGTVAMEFKQPGIDAAALTVEWLYFLLLLVGYGLLLHWCYHRSIRITVRPR